MNRGSDTSDTMLHIDRYTRARVCARVRVTVQSDCHVRCVSALWCVVIFSTTPGGLVAPF
jgi:hypothetical protein